MWLGSNFNLFLKNIFHNKMKIQFESDELEFNFFIYNPFVDNK